MDLIERFARLADKLEAEGDDLRAQVVLQPTVVTQNIARAEAAALQRAVRAIRKEVADAQNDNAVTTIYQDEHGYWLVKSRRITAGPFATWNEADDARKGPELACPHCYGRGLHIVHEDENGKDTITCETCGGEGVVDHLPPDEEIYHTSDRPTTVREQYEAAWAEKQALRS